MKKPKHWFTTLMSVLLDYGPIIATVGAAVWASFATVRQTISSDEVLQWILIVLTLVATTLLLDRFRVMHRLQTNLDHLRDDLQLPQGASSVFVQRIPGMEDRLRNATNVAIIGITLSRTSDSLFGTFKNCFTRGAEVRLAIVEPTHPALALAAQRFHKHQDVMRLRREAEHTLDNFAALTDQSGAPTKLHIKLTQMVPAYGIWLIDMDTPSAEIWVELYCYRAEPEPTFQLLPHRDGAWFTYFRDQFELIWQDAIPWQPTSTPVRSMEESSS